MTRLAFIPVLALATLAVVSPAEAATFRFDVADFAALKDVNRDGSVDEVIPGLQSIGRIRRISFEAGRLIEEPSSLCNPFGCTSTYRTSSFAEYDLSAFAGKIGHAELVFTRFVGSESLPGGSAFAAMAGIGVSGYAGDGSVRVSDYSASTALLASFGAPAQMVETYTVDVTTFMQSLAGSVAGFRFDMTGRGAANLLYTTYAWRDAFDFAATPMPYLSVTEAVAPVPVPASLPLLGSALAAFALLRRRPRQSA